MVKISGLMNSYHPVALFIGLLATLQFIGQVSALTQGVEYIVTGLTNDDAYYYLQTAWNTKKLGFPTFDGLHATNGVQFLWFWIIVLAALFSPTKTVLLFLAMVITFLLNVLSYIVIWKLGKTIQRPTLSLFMASFWFLLSFGSGIYSLGMENSLHALIFWLVLWQATVFLVRIEQNERPNLMGLTVLLILNGWVRLDAALFSVILYGYCLIEAFRRQALSIRQDFKYVAMSGMLALFGLIVQLTAFYLMGGSYLPVSTLVKQSRATWETALASSAPAGIGVMLLLALVGLRLYKFYERSPRLMAFRGVWYTVLGGVILHLAITSGINAYEHFVWYLSPTFIFLLVTLAMTVDVAVYILERARSVTFAKILPITICGFVIVASVFFFVVRLSSRNALYQARYAGSVWMSENLPADAICASWNAGQVGFFSERTVINLDGLINDLDYYERVLQGDETWVQYVSEHEVECIADHGRGRIRYPEFVVIQAFPLSGGEREFLVWQVLSLERSPEN